MLYPLSYGGGFDFSRFIVLVFYSNAGWQFIESGLFFLYARMIRSQNPNAMSAMYHSIVNLQIRLSMIDAAIRHTITDHPEIISEWDKLHRRIKKAASRRNDFVHFQVHPTESTNAKEPPRFLLHSSVFDVRHEKYREYSIKEISEIGNGFIQLKRDMDIFSERLGRVVPLPSLRKRRATKNQELFD